VRTVVSRTYKTSEFGTIPADWEVCTIGDELHFINGKAHEPFVSRFGKFIVVNSKFISTSGAVRKRCTVNLTPARRGDVLMVMSDLPNGRALAKCFLVDQDNTYAVNQRVCIFRSMTHDSRYLMYVLNRNRYFMAFDDGVQQTHLLNDPIKKCPFALPPREEQSAIADALSDADALIATLERLITKKQAIKQGMMQRVLAEAVNATVPMVDVTSRIGSGITPRGGSAVYKTSGRPFVRSQNVGWGNLRLDDLAYIDETTHRTFSASEIRAGDILLNITGASIGRSAVATPELDGGNVNQHVCELRVDKRVMDPHYVNAVLNSRTGQDQIDAFQAGGNRQGLNFRQVGSIRVPALAVTEQKAVGLALGDVDALIAGLDLRLYKAQKIKVGMLQQLLTGRTRLAVAESGG
jgi:type I restriction enzyme S subunit